MKVYSIQYTLSDKKFRKATSYLQAKSKEEALSNFNFLLKDLNKIGKLTVTKIEIC